MSEYIIQSETLTGIADAIRAKTGSSDPIQVSDMATQISSITGGGSADVRYVTFMNGSVELYKKAVAVGDDCVDVVSKGLIETPTKESTAQYSYTYYGWGASDGGAADSTILQNITEDKTVYAIFTAAVRYYTITWLDDDGVTVLKTESLAYGSTPSYTPSKDGHSFSNWVPELATVTGDASYTAVWLAKLSFANSTWADIARVSEAGQAAEHFALGDKRIITINGVDVEFQIAGFDHDDLAGGSGKAGMSILATQTTGDTTQWHTSTTKNYYSSALSTLINSYFSALEPELQAVIKRVKKTFDKDINILDMASQTESYNTERLWAPSYIEIGKLAPTRTTIDHGTTYARYSSFIASNFYSANDGRERRWWTRDVCYESTYEPHFVGIVGGSSAQSAKYQKSGTAKLSVVFGFCI